MLQPQMLRRPDVSLQGPSAATLLLQNEEEAGAQPGLDMPKMMIRTILPRVKRPRRKSCLHRRV